MFRLTHLVLFDHCRVKMPNVCPDIKLDFKDVLLRPKRSKIRSRADVSMDIFFCQYIALSTLHNTLQSLRKNLV